MRKEWEGFVAGNWTENIDVEEFIKLNYHPYDGDGSFLAGPTERTKACRDKVHELLVAERKAGGTLKVDASRIMRINAFDPGYIVPGKDIIVGLQTDEPLKRGLPIRRYQDGQRRGQGIRRNPAAGDRQYVQLLHDPQ